MPAIVKRHPALVGFAFSALVIGGTLVVLWVARGPSAQAAVAVAAMQPVENLDEVTWGRLQRVRQEAGLDDDALASLGLDYVNSVQVLQSLKSWFDQNEAQLALRWSALADQRGLIRNYRSQIDNGQDASQELASARTALTALESQHESFLADLRSSALASLTDNQRALVDSMRTHRGISMPYRALALTSEQESALRRALLAYEQQRSVAHTPELQANALGTFVSARDEALGATNLQAMASLASTLPAASAALTQAIGAVLPHAHEE